MRHELVDEEGGGTAFVHDYIYAPLHLQKLTPTRRKAVICVGSSLPSSFSSARRLGLVQSEPAQITVAVSSVNEAGGYAANCLKAPAAESGSPLGSHSSAPPRSALDEFRNRSRGSPAAPPLAPRIIFVRATLLKYMRW